MDLQSYSVDDYHRDHIINLIRHRTGWDNRGEISKKKQLKYLFSYLEDVNVKTTISESEYIDRHYLEDYSEYYVKCFNHHPRRCSRIHFFSHEFDEEEFISVLQNEEGSLSQDLLSQAYIGFIVIRPIPNTFLAKTCIKPYDSLIDKPEYKIITKSNPVSLFGISLTAKTVAIQEQDKVVASCATSALWVFITASDHMKDNQIPSLSSITKFAIPDNTDGPRTFPNKGLNSGQISKSLKQFGLEPTVYSYRDQGIDCLDEIKEIIHAYLGNDIPVLLGGLIYKKNKDKDKDDEIVLVGNHLICVLGYKIDDRYESYRNNIKLKSQSIHELYAHDDRYGPYAKIELNKKEWSVNKNCKIKGLLFTHRNDNDELFVPDLLIIGLYHKIRITYKEIATVCEVFHSVISSIASIILSAPMMNEELVETFKVINEGIWDISLTTSNTLKQDIIKTREWCSSNGEKSKSNFLAKLLPKYIWRCRITYDGEKITDILFDATEVPQGKLVLGYISYSKFNEGFWQRISKEIKNGDWEKYRNSKHFDEEDKLALNSIMKFFSIWQDDIGLNFNYGGLRLPKRFFKSGETNFFNNIQQRNDLYFIRGEKHGSLKDLPLDTNICYIWVINKNGDFVFGKDVSEETRDNYRGHPTLIDGEPARIGGELNFKNSEWVINTKSRTYSSHLKKRPDLQKNYLNIIINNKFTNKDIKFECLDSESNPIGDPESSWT